MKTITGLFDDYDDAAGAVSELQAIGVPDADIAIVASNSSGWYDTDRKVDRSEAGKG